MRPVLLLFCLLAATSCDEKSPVGPTAALSERFTLAPGEVASLSGTNLRVQFVEVTGDSRCPADAFCIQGGDAIVHVRAFERSDSPAAHELHTGDSSRASSPHGPYRIELVELQPYPFSSRTIAPGDYRATLTVTRP